MEKQYILPVGEDDTLRLDAQHQSYKQGITHALWASGLKEGQVIVDVGCGNGIMTEWLAKQVGDQGLVYAIDNDENQLRVAKERIKQVGLKNVEFCNTDLNFEVTQPFEADITYCCLVIQHLMNKEVGLKNLAAMTKADGSVMIVEPLNAMTWSQPKNDTFEKIMALFHAYTELNGVDCNYGKRLYDDISRIGLFKEFQIHGYQPITHDPDLKAMVSLQWKNMKPELLELKLMTQDEIDQISSDIEKAVSDPNILFGLPAAAILQCKNKQGGAG